MTSSIEVDRTDLQKRADLQKIVASGDVHGSLEFCRNLLSNRPERQCCISVIAPVYNEVEVVAEFHRRLTEQLVAIGRSYEIVLVDDGSAAETKSILAELVDADQNLTVVELSRNYGQQFAISAGLDYAAGDFVVIMDSDLQDPPELIPQMLSRCEEGYEVVYGIRRKRQEHLIKRLCYSSFYRFLRLLSSIEIPLDSGDFCLMSRRAIDELRKFPERNRFLRGLRSWIGFKQTGIPYERDSRYAGRPKYTIGRLVNLAFDGVFAFSYYPLRAISVVGFLVSLSSFALASYYLLKRIHLGLNPPGFATIVVAVFFFSGLILLTLGVLGEYAGRIYEEVKQRPLYIVRSVHSSRFPAADSSV